MKVCRKCKEEKPLEAFSKKRKGLQPKCKICAAQETREWYSNNKVKAKDTRLKINYGISHERFEEMLEEQNGCCAICGKNLLLGRYKADIACVDHNHSSGKVRGLLCNSCNRGLGYFFDNPEFLEKAIIYLEKTDAIHEKSQW